MTNGYFLVIFKACMSVEKSSNETLHLSFQRVLHFLPTVGELSVFSLYFSGSKYLLLSVIE